MIKAGRRRGCLSHARVALPLDLCHLASNNIDFKRAKFSNATFLALEGNAVAPGRQRSLKSTLVISGKFCCDVALVVLHHPRGVGKRYRHRRVSPYGAGLGGTDRNDSFDPRLRTRLRLAL